MRPRSPATFGGSPAWQASSMCRPASSSSIRFVENPRLEAMANQTRGHRVKHLAQAEAARGVTWTVARRSRSCDVAAAAGDGWRASTRKASRCRAVVSGRRRARRRSGRPQAWRSRAIPVAARRDRSRVPKWPFAGPLDRSHSRGQCRGCCVVAACHNRCKGCCTGRPGVDPPLSIGLDVGECRREAVRCDALSARPRAARTRFAGRWTRP